MRRLVLTGFMGTGKTTIGGMVAEQYGLRHVDLDREIEKRAGMTIGEIFAVQGQSAFRALESQVWRDVVDGEGCVISTGGGTLIVEENRALLGPDHAVMCLSCNLDELRDRLRTSGNRPLLGRDDPTRLESLLAERLPEYARFDQLDTTGWTLEEAAARLGERLELSKMGNLQFEQHRRSEILFERDVIDHVGAVLRTHGVSGDVLIISDETVDRLEYVRRIRFSLEKEGLEVFQSHFPAGEEFKTLDTVAQIYGQCMDFGLDRGATIAGVGGGVICDIAGMVAATYMRGLRLVLIPTTLLAQVDAAIGGKTGVDLHGAKNLVGAFYPADLVLIDPWALHTLPVKELTDGMAEVVKIAMIHSEPLLRRLQALHRSIDVLKYPDVIRSAASEKLRVVQQDPYDLGARMLLNFGHTIGHAMEAASKFRLSHGRSVAIGMVAEANIAARKGLCDDDLLDSLTELLDALDLPKNASGLSHAEIMQHMAHDKKRVDGPLRMALPMAPGAGAVVEVSGLEAERALDTVLGGIH